MLLVTGATGSNGTEIIQRLSAQQVPTRALVRDSNKAGAIALPGIEIATGDLDHPETLGAALAGVERAFLLTNSSEQAESEQLAFVEAAARAGVRHLVKLSQFAADRHSPVRFLRYHAAVEAAIINSGMAYTFLRPNLFMQGLLNVRSTIVSQNAFYLAADDAPVSVVDVRDIADVAVAALTQPGHDGKIYNLTGPEALTHTQMAAQLSTTLGRTITFVDIPPDTMRDALLGLGFPPYQADGLLEDYAHYRRGEASAVLSDIPDVLGKPPRPFAQFTHDYASSFS